MMRCVENRMNGIPVNLESDSDWESEQNRTSFVILIPISCSPSGEIRNNYFTTLKTLRHVLPYVIPKFVL